MSPDLCNNGHDRNVVGKNTQGYCRQCSRDKRKAYYHANRDLELSRNHAYRASDPEAYRKRNREQRKVWYHNNLHRARGLQAGYYQRLRADVIQAYGGSCAECGTTQQLELDHVNGDGAVHRIATVGESQSKVVDFYIYLRQNGFPNDPPLQVLCAEHHNDKTQAERRAKKVATAHDE